jgi:hypothetical protein
MKPAKLRPYGPSTGINDHQEEIERLVGERERIIARLQELDQQQLATYIRAPYLDLGDRCR